MLPLIKIAATLGPASESKGKIEELIEKGVNVFRFNLKHNTLDRHKKEINLFRRNYFRHLYFLF